MGIVGGIVAFISFGYVANKRDMIIPISDFFLIKYAFHILAINTGVTLIAAGALMYVGFLTPYYSEQLTKYEEAKLYVITLPLCLPTMVSWTCLVYAFPAAQWIQVAWPILMMVGIYTFVSSWNSLNKGPDAM